MTLSKDGALPRPGDEFSVDVFADRQRPAEGEESDELVMRGISGQRRFDVNVWVAGTHHFEVTNPRTATLTIDAEQEASNHLTFSVRVKEDVKDAADAALFAYFFYDGRPCGKVGRRIALRLDSRAPADGPASASVSVLEVQVGGPPPDLTIEITDPARTRRRLYCRVTARALPATEQPDPEEWNLPSESGELVRGLMEEFIRGNVEPAERILTLSGAGRELYEAAPESFKRILWTLIDRGTPPRSILVVSQEPYMPWELMVPARRRPDGSLEPRPPLGVEFSVGRWLHEDHLSPSARVPLVDSYVIAPTYPGPRPQPLPNAALEAQIVLTAVPGDRINPADLRTINSRLGAGGRSLLHFACHGADSPRLGIQAIYLDGGVNRLTSIQVGQIAGVMSAFRKKPLVFLNACEVGRPAISLVGVGGFAKAFIALGAAGVIAPLWSVRDTIAFDVAERFYHETKHNPGRSFAETLKEIRSLAYDPEIGEDTYAAYCFYVDPSATPS